MKKLLIRLIPDAIYEALEKTALHSERSLEAQARYILSCSVDNEKQLTGGERYQREITARLNQALSEANEVITAINLVPARIAEQLGHHDAIESENWFTGNAVPSFTELDELSDIFGCSPDWLKFGENVPYPKSSKGRINWNRGGEKDIDALLEPDNKGRKVSSIHIFRVNESGNILILREFENSITTDFFSTNLYLSDKEKIGQGGFHDLVDFLVILQSLYLKYINSSLLVKSYNISQYVLDSCYKSGEKHPITICSAGETSTWWEDIWHEDMIAQSRNNESYFWDGDKPLIDSLHKELQKNNRLKPNSELDMPLIG